MTPLRVAGRLGLVCLAAACAPTSSADSERATASAASRASSRPSSAAAPTAPPGSERPGEPAARFDDAAARACAARRASAAAAPEVTGAPAFERRRVELLGRVRGSPVLWRRAPEVSASPAARAFATRLGRTKRPLALVKDLLYRYARRPDELRDIVLRERYLYADEPQVGLAIVDTLRLTQLFHEQEIYLFRGGLLQRLERRPRGRFVPERYLHVDGPLAGRPAELLLGDRVGVDPSVARDPLAIDLLAAQLGDGFDRLRPTRLTASALLADVRYDRTWIPALFELAAGRATLACLAPTAAEATARAAYLRRSAAWRRAWLAIRETVRAEIEEAPPFDEPRDEAEGEQRDGVLRREWRRAYLAGRRRFEVGGHSYEVYDPRGRPIPPQVCTDFILDTWERSSGTWWAPLAPPRPGQKIGDVQPRRLVGGLQLGKEEELDNVRSVVDLVRFAAGHGEMFAVWDVPAEGRIPFRDRARFFRYLGDNADRFRLGDVYVVFGMKEGRPHYHSMMIMEVDPVTGVTTLVASNGMHAREQTLDGVLRLSPQRTIKHVLRPRPEYFAEAILRGSR
jgi:hypothetical protein